MTASQQCIRHFPVSLFASVMGMGGLSIACQKYAEVFGLTDIFGSFFLLLAYVCFAIVGSIYSYKLLRYRQEVIAEFNHPVRANFFPAISIGLLLLAIGTSGFNRDLAMGLWMLGAGVHLTFTVVIVSRWITRNYEIAHSNPAWFIPVVGNIIVPILGVELVNREISWFFFSIGVSFWLILFTIIVYRIVFHHQLAEKYIPTLFILIAPPAVGFISYVKLTGHFDAFAHILLYLALFLFLLLISMFPYFFRVRFFVSWWAYTFPLCALTIAMIAAFKHTGYSAFAIAATALLLVSFLAVVIVLLKTIVAFRQKTLCLPEE
jgi:tellurite resistance protein